MSDLGDGRCVAAVRTDSEWVRCPEKAGPVSSWYCAAHQEEFHRTPPTEFMIVEDGAVIALADLTEEDSRG